MKPIKNTLILVLLTGMSAALCSCGKEEITAGGEVPRAARLNISVTDGGYALSGSSAPARNAAPETRAAEDGYATHFTAGDAIGLYAVNPDGSYVVKNLCLTLTDLGDGTLAWQAPAGTELYHEGKTVKYFAYYPYQSTVTGTLQPTATTAADFFAGVVSAWTPATDQSTYAKYTAADLMTGIGTLGGKQTDGSHSLSFTMTHAMSLVVIELPRMKYTLTTDPDYTWIASASASDTKFYGFTPCRIDGVYRYLVKPAQSGATANLTGSYTGAGGNTKEYALPQNGILAARYAHYKVDGGSATVIERSHTLQIGDFYLHDGSLVGKGKDLSAEQQAACIGIVLKAGRDADGDWKDDCEYKLKGTGNSMTDIHGYVLGLYDAKDERGNTVVPQWGSFGTEVNHTDMNREQNTGFYGYKNTNAIKAFAAKKDKTLKDDFPATYYATKVYEDSYPAPANSSGWFLPSAGQGKYWLNNKDVILASVRKATGNSGYNWQYYYWSSSEGEYGAWNVDFYHGYVEWNLKFDSYYVRGVFAF